MARRLGLSHISLGIPALPPRDLIREVEKYSDAVHAVDEDAELRGMVDRARAKDANAWEWLFRRLYTRLFSYARNRLPSDPAADDAVSETMLRAVEKIDGFHWQGAGFDGWVFGIARNVVREHHRQWGRGGRVLSAQRTEAVATSDPSAGDPQRIIAAKNESQLVMEALDHLEASEREIIELRVVGELSSEAVAHVVGKSAGAVRMSQMRALKRLRHLVPGLINE